MAKITVYTDEGVVYKVFEYNKHEDFSTNLSKAYMWDEIEDALFRAIAEDKKRVIEKKKGWADAGYGVKKINLGKGE